MVATLVLAVALSAAPLPRLAAPGLSAVNVDSRTSDLFTEYFAQQLNQYGIRVTTKNEIAALIGFERQKQLLGCADDSSSCLAELGGALGVDGVITGSLGRVGSSFLLTLKIVRSGDGSAMGSYSGRPETEEAALDWLSGTARRFAQEIGAVQEPGLRRQAWIPAGLGVVAGGVGAYLFLDSKGVESNLRTGTVPVGQLDSTIEAAQGRQSAGVVLMGIGVVGLVTGATFYFLGGSPSAPVIAAAPVENGVLATVSGRWP